MMLNDIISQVLNYIMRVITWSFNYLVIWPFAAIVIITSFLFWRDNITPGTEIVRAVSAEKMEASTGKFIITRCRVIPDEMTKKEIPVTKPICEKETIKVNADEYASHIDSELWRLFRILWTTLAVVFGLIAYCLRTFPSFRSGGRKQYSYGIARKVSSEAKETE